MSAQLDGEVERKILVGRVYHSMNTTWHEWPESTFDEACNRMEKKREENKATEAADEIIEVIVVRRARVRTEVSVERVASGGGSGTTKET